jgi:hypothetical protein
MIKVQIKDKTYEASDAVNVVLTKGWKVFKIARTLKSLAQTLIEWAIGLMVAAIILYASAYIHEIDLLTACDKKQEITLLHSDFKVNSSCVIVHSA